MSSRALAAMCLLIHYHCNIRWLHTESSEAVVLTAAEIQISCVKFIYAWWCCQQDGEVLVVTGVLVYMISFRLLALSLNSLQISSHFCQRRFNSTLPRFIPAWWRCHRYYPPLSSLLPNAVFCVILDALAPSSWPPRSPPPPQCPLTTWHLFRFIPISWQTACISTQRAQCGDPHQSISDKSMLSLFSMPLLPSIFPLFFPPCYFAVCRDLNFAQLNRVHFQEQISSETDTNVSSGG